MTAWRIYEGDCLEGMANLPPRCVHTVVTSPPYFGLRDYGTDGQFGLEADPETYVATMVQTFDHVRRVLRDDGTVWLNLGDSYVGGGGGNYGSGLNARREVVHTTGTVRPGNGVKAKDMLGIPWAVAFALRDAGWYLRCDVIWSKPNPMPESVMDRPTKSHEYVFLLSKSPRYFYDGEAIRETFAKPVPVPGPESGSYSSQSGRNDAGRHAVGGFVTDQAARNKRSVWTVATQPYPGAHFATFPAKLIEPCVLAGSPERACGVCGAPWRRVVELIGGQTTGRTAAMVAKHSAQGIPRASYPGSFLTPDVIAEHRTVGFEPTCDHADDTGTGLVLDPFAGAGTTGLVALRWGRSFVGVELNGAYAEMARMRIMDDAPLLNTPTHADGEPSSGQLALVMP